VSAEAGAAQLCWIDEATDLVASGQCRALVTAPASKAAVAASGLPGAAGFSGHTEHLAARLRAREVVMAFWSPRLTTSLVTTHLPLADVAPSLSAAAVARSCYWLVRLLCALGATAPRVAVAALNPHAGEGGLLGEQEARVIAPGMRLARRRLRRAGIEAQLLGPLGAETAYRLAARGVHHGVVAMYHDQATIASKLLDFGRAVNVSLGLPIVRTSVDHGTAYDLALRPAAASCRPMVAAVRLAARLASAKW